MKKPLIKKMVHYLNVPKHLSNHLIGEHHSHGHRMLFDTIIMVIGVIFSRSLPSPVIVHIMGEMVGFGVHGIGLIPFVEYLNHNKQQESQVHKEPCVGNSCQ